VNRKPLDDPRVRKAFALVTIKSESSGKSPGKEKAAAHFVPDGVARYQSPPGLDYNVEQARKLLAEAGFPDGKGSPAAIQFLFSSERRGKNAGQNRGRNCSRCGAMGWVFEIELAARSSAKIFYSAQSRMDYDISGSSWIGDYNDANTFSGSVHEQ